MIKLPNLLIIGVPKAGTTSLYFWLKQHPEVFMSPVKEPHYFSQIKNPKHIENWESYVKLFKKAKNEKIIGEASVSYFHFYERSIPLIKEKLGNPKLIVILRNPIERAWSHYQYYIKSGHEKNNPDKVFDKSYVIENDPWGWNLKNPYIELSFYSEPLKNFLANFKNVKILLYDNLKSNPQSLIKDVYSFLNVDVSFIPNFEVRNVSGEPRNKLIKYILSLNMTQKIIPKIPYPIKAQLRGVVFKKNEIPVPIKERLKNVFEEDIKETSKLLNKDLSFWLK